MIIFLQCNPIVLLVLGDSSMINSEILIFTSGHESLKTLLIIEHKSERTGRKSFEDLSKIFSKIFISTCLNSSAKILIY